MICVFLLATIFTTIDDHPGPLAPADTLKSIHTKPGLKVELVASEPLIVDPVAIDWGTDGTLWVCEMHDYPMGLDGKFKPGGRIKALRDSDGDGIYDKSTTFLDGLPFPTGVMAWRKGVLVCAAPEILYAEDTDGDGKADLRKTLFRGFATDNYQARVNGLSYGLDNWVYGANGLIGGVIKGEANGKTIDIGGRDFRFKPDTGEMEPASGLTQQGRIHDDFNNQFGNSNSVLLQHYPFPDHYAKRNPYVATTTPALYVPKDADSARLFPASVTQKRFNEPQSANRVTSACGPCIYRDNLLGGMFRGNAFICEPVHNLVHREVLSEDGVTFAGHRAPDEKQSEFLASTDPWFRPVQVRTGPDGALYVVDMYRSVIEHPRWISPEVLKSIDVRAGEDKGRIYRVVSETLPLRPVPNLDKLPTVELAEQLNTLNGTQRDNVQRLLVHRGDLAAVPGLEKLAKTSIIAGCRAQALGTLDGLGALKNEVIRARLKDLDSKVRAVAVRFAEPRLNRDPELGVEVVRQIDGADLAMRFQLALSLGEWDDARAGQALGRLAVENADNPWIVSAVHSSAIKRPGAILEVLLRSHIDSKVAASVVGPIVTTAAKSGRLMTVATAFAAAEVDQAAWRLSILADLLDALPDDPIPREILSRTINQARTLARDQDASTTDRALAFRLLGRDSKTRADDISLLGDLLVPKSSAKLQAAVVSRLDRIGGMDASKRLIAAWPGLGPEVRTTVLDSLLARREGIDLLMTAAEHGEVPRGEFPALHRQRLTTHEDNAIRRRAEALWAVQNRTGVLASYPVASMKSGDAAKGAKVFGRVCATCHKIDGQGFEVGPDLAALTDRSPEALLPSIFDPNREIDARYISYIAALKDGRILTGMMASESGNSMTLKHQGGTKTDILRADLDEFKSTGKSLMPEGLERDVSPADCADLLAFLAGRGPKPKTIAGNTPKLVVQAEDGSIWLPADSAEIYGSSLTFETEFNNLGFWQSPDDHPSWTFRVKRPARYEISMRAACPDDAAGGKFVVRSGDRTIHAKVAGTGPDWSNYRVMKLGEMEFPAGEHRLEVKMDGVAKGALMDLQSVTLKPIR